VAVGKAIKLNVKHLELRIWCQDEARFGRMSDPRRCWAQTPHRPSISTALVREYKYVIGAVCPQTGCLEYMPADNMKTPNMSRFLKQVSKRHDKEFIVMLLDNASTHKSKDLIIPPNVNLVFLPPYSPELNPSEQLWNIARRDYIANRYFLTLDDAMTQLKRGLSKLKRNRKFLSSLTNFDWIQKTLSYYHL
jgi:transposase